MILTLLIALVVGFVVYLLCSLFPQTSAHAALIGLIVTILWFLFQSGLVR